MADVEFNLDEMVDPIERMFDREFESVVSLFENVDEEEEQSNKSYVQVTNESPVHFVYIEGADGRVHAVRAEETYDGCLFNLDGGIHCLYDVKANYRWVALPLNDFRDGEELYNDIMIETCRERGYGIITVQPKGQGVSAKVILPPQQLEGNFLEFYDVKKHWRALTRAELEERRFKLVNFYEG